ncbi:protein TRIGALACTOSYLDIACYLGLYCEROL 3, chloroplastic-like isoform X2 [Macadamia integrifolia]|uniref:protein TRIGALACTOSYLDIACYLGLYCEROL 3, chloroplastic-like isoform X2 n=1 Tax=Macadamia integrifolia TaxID=60698 RepID=UPI001C500511|nr:protein TRIGALACTOSYLDIACYLGLYCEROL 3, chloroplastic-like isoform X2 [Macadamia integrifolia]
MLTNIVSTANSSFLPLNHFGGTSRSARLLIPSRRSLGSCSSERKIVCACTAPPRKWPDGFSGVKFNDSSSQEKDSPAGENLSMAREVEDDSDVLIECRNVYKSFGEKHILRGVSFKTWRSCWNNWPFRHWEVYSAEDYGRSPCSRQGFGDKEDYWQWV